MSMRSSTAHRDWIEVFHRVFTISFFSVQFDHRYGSFVQLA